VLANLLIAASVILRETVGNGSPLWLWAVAGSLDLTYLVASLVAAFITARRDGWTLLPVLPVVFATYHLSYGVGFVLGIFYFSTKAPTSLQRETVFTQLSR
jgi:hypothetical protein